MNYFGLIVGFATLIIIGVGFVWVIYGERYLGHLWWVYVLGLGFLLVCASLYFQNDWISACVGILGASFIWGSDELKTQALRAKLGWFPYRAKKINPPLRPFTYNRSLTTVYLQPFTLKNTK